MMKTVKTVLSLVLVIAVVLALFACGKKEKAGSNPDDADIGEIYYQETPAEHIASTEAGVMYADNELLVVAKDGVKKSEIEELAEKYNAIIIGYIEKTGDYQWKLNESYSKEDLDSFSSSIKDEQTVERVSVNYISGYSFTAVDSNINPGEEFVFKEDNPGSDTMLNSWNLDVINAWQAWDLMNDHKSEINPVRLGLIDGLADANNPDLELAEIINDSGKTDGHGTFVAGIMAANGLNDEGISGIFPYSNDNNKLLYCYSLSEEEIESFGIMALKATFAEMICRNVKVINYSLASQDNLIAEYWFRNNKEDYALDILKGLDKRSSELGSFLNRLLLKKYDFIIVPGAGNDSNLDECYFEINGIKRALKNTGDLCAASASELNRIRESEFPDVYKRIIVVGGICYDGSDCYVWDHSEDGVDEETKKNRVDVYAPAENIPSTIPKVSNNKCYKNDGPGTSFAAPHVSGLAADIWSVNNGFTGEQVKDTIINNTDDKRIINAEATVKKAFEYVGNSIDKDSKNGFVLGYVVDKEEYVIKDDEIIAGVIPGARIIVVDVETGKEFKEIFMTDESGQFELILPPGKYALSVVANGYESYALPKTVKVDEQQITHIDDLIKLTRKSGFSGGNTSIEESSDSGTSSTSLPERETRTTVPGDRATTKVDYRRPAGYPAEGQKYWVIFEEGFRSDRVELSTFDVIGDDSSVYGIWDGNLYAESDTGEIDGYNQFHYDDGWVYDRNYGVLTDKTHKIIAANFDIYDDDGNLMVPASDNFICIPYDAVCSDDGHYYKVYPEGTVSSYEKAKAFCEKNGGYLAVISSDDENEFLYEYITDEEIYTAYFGYSDSEKEGSWKWTGGEKSGYTNWHSGEPDSENSNEDYAEFYWKFDDGTWNDGDFGNNTVSDSSAFICEWAPDYVED